MLRLETYRGRELRSSTAFWEVVSGRISIVETEICLVSLGHRGRGDHLRPDRGIPLFVLFGGG